MPCRCPFLCRHLPTSRIASTQHRISAVPVREHSEWMPRWWKRESSLSNLEQMRQMTRQNNRKNIKTVRKNTKGIKRSQHYTRLESALQTNHFKGNNPICLRVSIQVYKQRGDHGPRLSWLSIFLGILIWSYRLQQTCNESGAKRTWNILKPWECELMRNTESASICGAVGSGPRGKVGLYKNV